MHNRPLAYNDFSPPPTVPDPRSPREAVFGELGNTPHLDYIPAGPPGGGERWGEKWLGLGNRTMQSGVKKGGAEAANVELDVGRMAMGRERTAREEEEGKEESPASRRSVELWPGSM